MLLHADEDAWALKVPSFKERLLLTAPVLMVEDVFEPGRLLSTHPMLAACVIYITSRYISGYHELRESLRPIIMCFLEMAPITSSGSSEEKMGNMQALLILYIYSRSGSVAQVGNGAATSDLGFWLIKGSCEAYALHINLHRAVDHVTAHWRSGAPLRRDTKYVQQYLYWLWMFTTSHQ
jgi:hypothetical protein